MASATRITWIDCNGPAAVGVQKALTTRFKEMYRFRAAALRWQDPEGVHSMRVASRRLRSALKGFMPFVNQRPLSSSLRQIRSIADTLGQVRDQDVALMALEELLSQIPGEFSETLQQIIALRKETLAVSRQKLKEVIARDRMNALRLGIMKAIALATSGKRTEISYKDMARTIIRDRLTELEELGFSLYRPLDADEHHEARIAAKRLRYAIELFDDCWKSKIIGFAKSTAHLQTALGAVHDCDVWIDSFSKELIQATRSKEHDRSKSFAWLLTHYNKLRHKHFQEAFSLWTDWKANEISEALLNEVSN